MVYANAQSAEIVKGIAMVDGFKSVEHNYSKVFDLPHLKI